jgi:Polyketide cyclase / dehydrase and lipid transport
MTQSDDVETVERTIPARPEAIFALLADPSRHHDIDGSGTVKEAQNAPERVKLGDKFGMAMKRGVPYSTHNVVIQFDDNRCIAWQHSTAGAIGESAVANFLRTVVGPGAIWRYELEPADGGTKVHETWDFSPVRGLKPLLRLARSRNDTRAAMEKTLENIEKVLAGS